MPGRTARQLNGAPPMSDKDATIAEIETAYREFMTAVEGIPPDRMTDVFYDQWSTKDLVAHTASLDEFTVGDLQRIARGHLPCFAAFKESEVDDWNAFFMRPRRLFPPSPGHVRICSLARSGRRRAQRTPGLDIRSRSRGQHLCRALRSPQDAGNIREWRERQGI